MFHVKVKVQVYGHPVIEIHLINPDLAHQVYLPIEDRQITGFIKLFRKIIYRIIVLFSMVAI